MAQFVAQCPHCKQQFNAQTEWIGQQANCPACGMVFTITATAQTPNVMPQPDNDFIAQCPHCKNQFRAQAAWAGQQANCPSCGNSFVIMAGDEKRKLPVSLWRPDGIFSIVFSACFLIYFFCVVIAVSNYEFNEYLPSALKYYRPTIFDVLLFNIQTSVLGVDIRIPFLPSGLCPALSNVMCTIPPVVLIAGIAYLIYALKDGTAARRYSLISSCVSLSLAFVSTVLVLYRELGLKFLGDVNYQYPGASSDRSGICYVCSTVFYALLLIVISSGIAVLMKHKMFRKKQ